MISEQWLQNHEYQFWMLQLIGLSVWLVTFAAPSLYEGHSPVALVFFCGSAVTGCLLTTGMRYFYRMIWERPAYVRIAEALAVSFILAVIWLAIQYFWGLGYFPELLMDPEKLKDPEWSKDLTFTYYFSAKLGYTYFLMVCWSSLYFGVKYYQLFHEEREKTLSAIKSANEAQLRMLRYQLNPHFLFNTLNAISTLILERENRTANTMVSRLSRFLRYSLDNDPMQKVDLEYEINTLELYLDIEKVRFEERLKVQVNVEESARHALIPSLLLQPLVENSIKYAIAGREEGGTISIEARVFAKELLLEVSDDGPGIDTEDGNPPTRKNRGVGIRNTRERLQQMYGGDHSCKFSSSVPHGLKVNLRIPFETA
jgi:two-component system LytT family sensor kinase